MFLYISFLRPPPVAISLTGSISITPQISNDLRTEPFAGSQDIYYSWSQDSSDATSRPQATAVKLTTYRANSAYKAITIRPPHGARAGQSWRLVLGAQASGTAHIINLMSSKVGLEPLPVMSMPIIFGQGGGGGDGHKQEQIERVYRMAARGDAGNLQMIIREQTSFDLDKKIWDSGIGLSSWILDLYAGPASENHPELRSVLFSPGQTNILELGAGTGIVALTIGALRPSPTSDIYDDAGTIITTDLASAMPLLEHNISANAHLFAKSDSAPANGCQPRAAVLDWDEDLPAEIRALSGGIDAIVMADVTYNTSSFPALIATLDSLRHSNATQNLPAPVVLLGYKERDQEERTLWTLAREIGLGFERVGERKGCGGQEVEAWVGRWTRLI